MSIREFSNNLEIVAVHGQHDAGGTGVYGNCTQGEGTGVVGASENGRGVVGLSTNSYGVVGESQKLPGVRGNSVEGRGVEGWSTKDHGVLGISKIGTGVHGFSEGTGTGVFGECKAGTGVQGVSETWRGVFGYSRDEAGVVGESGKFHAVWALSHGPQTAGVFGANDAGGFGVLGISDHGIGIHGKGKLAGRFEGDVEVHGNIHVNGDVILPNADCAEEFDIVIGDGVEPGTVVVLDEEGRLRVSVAPYDTRVAGVISGAGQFKPGIVLDKQAGVSDRLPVALLGKVFCKVIAGDIPIRVGDLLTTSSIPGHAMRATDSARAFGSVIGKALRSHSTGAGLIPILVALQ